MRAFDPEEISNPLVSKFLTATKTQGDALRGTQMEVDIDAQIPKLKESGKMRLVKSISKLGKVVFRRLGDFVGDKTVQNQVIARYLELESENSENTAIAITPDNYKFRLKTKMTQGDSHVDILELTPKKGKKAVGLFKGELWVDDTTGMPLRESGTLVKKSYPFSLKSIAFVNEYKLQDGISLPSHIECHVDTHIAGRADLNIRFSNVTPAANVVPVAAAQQAQIADAP